MENAGNHECKGQVMKKLLLLATALSVGFIAAAPAAIAQGAPARTECAAGQKACAKQLNKSDKSAKAQPAVKQTSKNATKTSGPKVGESGRKGQPFQRNSSSRFSSPPKGQDYRVVNDHLVLVDKSDQKIVRVIGLLNELLN